ncbi:MAG: hypothetical protein KAI22_12390 [Gammaproteobacteria bacterium]|nr:hypothetical protein [Gammaproteobacteria bacterium]
MDSTEQESDRLLQEIIQLELEIDRIMALNGNRENYVVRQYRQFILAKRNKMRKMNYGYKNLLPNNTRL